MHLALSSGDNGLCADGDSGQDRGVGIDTGEILDCYSGIGPLDIVGLGMRRGVNLCPFRKSTPVADGNTALAVEEDAAVEKDVIPHLDVVAKVEADVLFGNEILAATLEKPLGNYPP